MGRGREEGGEGRHEGGEGRERRRVVCCQASRARGEEGEERGLLTKRPALVVAQHAFSGLDEGAEGGHVDGEGLAARAVDTGGAVYAEVCRQCRRSIAAPQRFGRAIRWLSLAREDGSASAGHAGGSLSCHSRPAHGPSSASTEHSPGIVPIPPCAQPGCSTLHRGSTQSVRSRTQRVQSHMKPYRSRRSAWRSA